MAAPDEAIRLIAGLGNPGARYADTRHNAGAWWARLLAERAGAALKVSRAAGGATAALDLAGTPLRLLVPDAYVNVSGAPVAAACRYYRVPPAALLVAHDDIDLPCGAVRLKFGGSAGGHNGLRDVARLLGPEFWRLRLGVGRPERASQVEGYVLRAPDAAERARIDAALARAAAELPALARGEHEAVMNRLHGPEPEAA